MAVADTVVDYDSFLTWIGIQTEAGKRGIKQQLKEWISNPAALLSSRDRFQRIQKTIQRDPVFAKECTQLLDEIAEIEKKVMPLMVSDSKLEKESYNELLFVHPIAQPLNFIPMVLTIWSFLRVYLLPGLSLLFPILTLIAPYFILTYLFHLPITFKNYTHMLQSMIGGNIKAVLDPTQGAPNHVMEPTAFLKQMGMILLTLVQGIIQPYWTYKHLHSIDHIIVEHGTWMMRFREKYARLESLLATKGITFFDALFLISPQNALRWPTCSPNRSHSKWH